MIDLVRISGGDVIVIFHRRRSRRSYARQKRTPRPEHKYFLFSRWFTAGTLSLASQRLQTQTHRWPQIQNFDGCLRDQMVGHVGERLLAYAVIVIDGPGAHVRVSRDVRKDGIDVVMIGRVSAVSDGGTHNVPHAAH